MAVAAAAVSLSVGDGGVGLNASTAAAAAAEDLPSNMTEMEMMEDFVRTMVEDWRYQVRIMHTALHMHVYIISIRINIPIQARVSPPSYVFIILLYASLILFGATGNLLVILVVVRNRAMRTARNVFIVNLAVSDLMLCLITMPLTLVEILYQTWQVCIYCIIQNKTCERQVNNLNVPLGKFEMRNHARLSQKAELLLDRLPLSNFLTHTHMPQCLKRPNANSYVSGHVCVHFIRFKHVEKTILLALQVERGNSETPARQSSVFSSLAPHAVLCFRLLVLPNGDAFALWERAE